MVSGRRFHCLTVVDQFTRESLAVEAWRIDYNQVRPHSSLGNLTPEEFVGSLEEKKESNQLAAVA